MYAVKVGRRLFWIGWLAAMMLAAAWATVPALAAPGDQQPVSGVHPSYDLAEIRPEGFPVRVGGMDFLPDGRLVVAHYEPGGGVYIYDHVLEGNREAVEVKKIASGLYKPLGLRVVNGQIYVLQSNQLTLLIDHDGDDVIDEYRTVATGWDLSDNFHEFSFGLLYHEEEGKFYATLSSPVLPGGASQVPSAAGLDRGTVIRIDPSDGSFEVVARGLRTPNGIGFGVDGEMFVTDNQGAWLPANKLIHVQEGAFYGFRDVDPVLHGDLPETPAAVLLPQGEIGNSPSEPTLIIDESPYAGQMLHGDVHHGGLKRVFLEKVDGVYQGAVFRFSQGLEAGINRLVWGPDGALYLGGIGFGGNWGHMGNQYGLQRIRYNGKTTFEMLAVRAKTNGMEIEFTEPLALGVGTRGTDYTVAQWNYQPTPAYGGPKRDYEFLPVREVHVSSDRRTVFLELDGLKPGSVVYIRLSGEFTNEAGERPWSTEAWYTLNRIPENNNGAAPPSVHIATDPYPPSGKAPLAVSFAAENTGASEIVSYVWDLGDGTTAVGAEVAHTYEHEGVYTVRLTVADAQGWTTHQQIEVAVGNHFPVPVIRLPQPGLTVQRRDAIVLDGIATDPEDGDLPPERLTWTVSAIDAAGFVQPIASVVGYTGSVDVPDTVSWDDHVVFRVELTATDSDNHSWTEERLVRFSRLQAEHADGRFGFRNETDEEDENVRYAVSRHSGDYLVWYGLDLTHRSPVFIQAQALSGQGDVYLEIRLDHPDGERAGAVVVSEAGEEPVAVPLVAEGIHDLYLVATAGDGGPVSIRVDWIQLIVNGQGVVLQN